MKVQKVPSLLDIACFLYTIEKLSKQLCIIWLHVQLQQLITSLPTFQVVTRILWCHVSTENTQTVNYIPVRCVWLHASILSVYNSISIKKVSHDLIKVRASYECCHEAMHHQIVYNYYPSRKPDKQSMILCSYIKSYSWWCWLIIMICYVSDNKLCKHTTAWLNLIDNSSATLWCYTISTQQAPLTTTLLLFPTTSFCDLHLPFRRHNL